MAVRYIYFDLGNVLLNFDHHVACRQVAALMGAPWSLVREIIFESGLQHRYERGEISDDEFCDIFCQTAGVTLDLNSLLQATSDIFSLNIPVIPIVARLSAAGYPLGILSNTCRSHWNWVRQKKYGMVSNLFENTVLSFQLGSMKPDAPIYLEAIRRTELAPEEIFFVDDRPENVEGARRLGIDAVLYESAYRMLRDLDERGIRLNL
jgi:putative hydrolase of the HAD superfamily